MKRLEKFNKLIIHIMHKKLWERLSKSEKQECVDFIAQNDHLDKNEFAHKVNR